MCIRDSSIGIGVVLGMLVGVLIAYGFSRLFGFNDEITHSLMARSISTPFAIELAKSTKGSAELATAFTMMTGITGVVIGDFVLGWIKLDSHFAQGAAFGNAAHGFGSAKAMQRHQEEGVIASLTMVVAGLFMVLVGPWLITSLTT